MRSSRTTTLALVLAALAGATAVHAAEQIPTAPIMIRALPKPQPRFLTPPTEDIVTGTRLVNPAAGAAQVDRFEFIGATAIPAAELEQRVASFAGRALASTDIDAAAEEVAKLYRSRGYPLAAVALAGPVAGGVARMQVYEGRLAKVRIEGNDQYATEAIAYPFTQLPKGKALTDADLEASALALDEQPGLDVRVQALPAATPGESDLVIRVTERAFQANGAIDNDGVEAAGRQRIWAGFDLNSPTGWGDQLSLLLMNSDRFAMDYARVEYSIPVDAAKRAGVYYALGKWEGMGDGIGALDVRGKSSEFQAWFSLPLARTRAFSREVRFWFERLEGSTLVGPVEFESGDLKTYGVALHDSSWGTDGTGWSRSVEFDTNLENNDALDPKAHLGQLRLSGMTLNDVGAWQILAKGRVVYSLEQVVPLKQFRVGGPDSVRAYDYSQEAGDSGFDATVEFLAPLAGSGFQRTQFALFVDAGYTSFHDDQPLPAYASGLIGGAGLGLRFRGASWRLELDYAHPIGQRDAPDDDTNGYFWGRIAADF